MRVRAVAALVFALFRLWRRLPPRQRAELTRQLRRHGPGALTALAGYLRTSRRSPRRRR